MEAGALLADADKSALSACIAYGMHLGLAFQMVDDLLDVEGDAALLGKNTGMDAQRGKLTWIAAHGIDQTREDARLEIHQALSQCYVFGDDAKFFEALAFDTLKRVQ